MPIDPNLYAGQVCKDLLVGNPNDTFPTVFGILGNIWLELSAVALLSSLFILTLVYILANFLRNQTLMAWTKFELYQILGTAVVVLFTMLAIITGMCTFDLTFLGENDPAGNHYLDSSGQKKDMYEIVADYFNYIEQVGYLLFGYLMWVVKQINFIAKIMWTSSPLGVGSSESPLESLSQLNNLMFIMVSGYVISFLLLQLQMRMMEYLAIAVLYFIFPFGIFFRSFEPTRLFGGTLIGLSISFFLFYPITIVFNDYIIYSHLTLTEKELTNTNPALGETPLQNAADPHNQLNNNEETADMVTNELELQVNTIDKSVVKARWEGFVSGVSGAFFFLFKPLLLYFIAAVVLPVINFIVLVETTKGITKLFGEEIDVTNLTRLI